MSSVRHARRRELQTHTGKEKAMAEEQGRGSDDEEGGEMNVHVKTLQSSSNESEVTVRVPPTASVQQLKEAIETATGVNVPMQRVIYRGRVLSNEQSLSSWGLAHNHTVHMVQRQQQPYHRDREHANSDGNNNASHREHLFRSLERSIGSSGGGIFSLAVDIAPREHVTSRNASNRGVDAPTQNARASLSQRASQALAPALVHRNSRLIDRSDSMSETSSIQRLYVDSRALQPALREMVGADSNGSDSPQNTLAVMPYEGSSVSTADIEHARQHLSVHNTITCDSCETSPLTSRRFKSMSVEDYDLCEGCFEQNGGQEGRCGPFACITTPLPTMSSTLEHYGERLRSSRAYQNADDTRENVGTRERQSLRPFTEGSVSEIANAMSTVVSNHQLTQQLMQRARTAAASASELEGDDRYYAQADLYQAAAAMEAHASMLHRAAQSLPGLLLGHSADDTIMVSYPEGFPSLSSIPFTMQRGQQQQRQPRAVQVHSMNAPLPHAELRERWQRPQRQEQTSVEEQQQPNYEHSHEGSTGNEQQEVREREQQAEQTSQNDGENSNSVGWFVREGGEPGTRISRGLRISIPIGSEDTTNMTALIENAIRQAGNFSGQQEHTGGEADQEGEQPNQHVRREQRPDTVADQSTGSYEDEDATSALMGALRQLGLQQDDGRSSNAGSSADAITANESMYGQQQWVPTALDLPVQEALSHLDHALQTYSEHIPQDAQESISFARRSLRRYWGEDDNGLPGGEESHAYERNDSQHPCHEHSTCDIGVQADPDKEACIESTTDDQDAKYPETRQAEADGDFSPSGLGGTSLPAPPRSSRTSKKKKKQQQQSGREGGESAGISHASNSCIQSEGRRQQQQQQSHSSSQQQQSPHVASLMQQLLGAGGMSTDDGNRSGSLQGQPDLTQMLSQVAQSPHFQQLASQLGAPPDMLQSMVGGSQYQQRRQSDARHGHNASRDWREEVPQEHLQHWQAAISDDLREQEQMQEQPPLSDTYLAGRIPDEQLGIRNE